MRWYYYGKKTPKPKSRILYHDGGLYFVANVDTNGFLFSDQFYCNDTTCNGKKPNDCECAVVTAPHHLWAPIHIPNVADL